MTRLQIAALYDYSTRTLTRRLAAHGIALKPRRLIERDAQLSIYARLGRPCQMQPKQWQALLPALQRYCREQGLPEPPSW